MALQTNKSVMAIVPEVTDGTPVSPSSASQYVVLQEGFDASPEFEVLENAELSGSIGSAKPVLGLENPTASFSHYLKHSGTEGIAPEHSLALEAAFGAKSVASTEYDTIAASTVAVIKVNTGEGVTFERGEALLVKDPVNGYNIRPILSISGDDLTLGMQLSNAPGTSVNLGKAVLYKPGEAHPTFTSWLYMANGGAVQMLAGSRVTEMTINAEAGQFINSDFSVGAVGYYFNPIEITASTDTLDFFDGVSNRVATVASGFFKDPKDLAAALQVAMNAAGSSDTFTVIYSDSTGKFTLSSSGATFTLKFLTGANTAQTIAAKIGFAVVDETGATSYISDNALSLASPQTPSYNTTSPLVAKANEVLIGDSSTVAPACFGAQSVSFTLGDEKTDVLSFCAESGKSGSLITKREVSVEVVAQIPQYDADKFHRFHQGTNTSFVWNFGEKSGGNWLPGKSGCLYIPTGTISAYKLSDDNGLVTLEMTITAYVSGGLGEVYLNLL